jgi:hypothetical protein
MGKSYPFTPLRSTAIDRRGVGRNIRSYFPPAPVRVRACRRREDGLKKIYDSSITGKR